MNSVVITPAAIALTRIASEYSNRHRLAFELVLAAIVISRLQSGSKIITKPSSVNSELTAVF